MLLKHYLKSGVYIYSNLRKYNNIYIIRFIVFLLEYNACKAHPCKNGGTCLNNGYTYECRCNGSYEGPNCKGECLVTYKTKYAFLVRNVYLF